MNMEHRCGYRRPTSTAVVIRAANGLAARGHLCDISASGALVRSHFPAPLHGQVLLQFSEATRDSRRSRPVVRGEIVRHTSDGFAIEWSEFSPTAVRSLLREITGEMTALQQAERATGRIG